MNFRRIYAAILIVMLSISMCACGNNNDTKTNDAASADSSQESDTIQDDSTSEDLGSKGNNSEDTEETKPQNPLLKMPESIDFSAINSILPGRVTVEGTEFVVDGENIYMNGSNVPWNNWNDFGGSFNKKFWNEHFATLHESGINSVRVWISCNGDAGMSITKEGYVNGASTKHWEHLDTLFTLAEENGIYVMATLMSFDHFKDSNNTYNSWRTMIQDETLMDSYVENYLIPFCERYDDFNSLWSIDLCNEPDWIYENSECGKISWENICKFFAKEASAIHDNSDILVTIGFGMIKYNSEIYSGNMGSDEYLQSLYADEAAYLDFYSTHYYEWEATWYGFPFDVTPTEFGLDGTKPCVLGEFPAVGMLGNVNGSKEMSADDCYINLYNNWWNGAFAWTSNGVDDCGSLEDFKTGAMEVYNMIYEVK
ncbi:MAG: cellulase (glycosyl hydrolase family 5) [Lachnospiraceae bacterium]|nr:cellulase (glycosyl hydrolase family 5) [Lachnospiraceae bacterium]